MQHPTKYGPFYTHFFLISAEKDILGFSKDEPGRIS